METAGFEPALDHVFARLASDILSFCFRVGHVREYVTYLIVIKWCGVVAAQIERNPDDSDPYLVRVW